MKPQLVFQNLPIGEVKGRDNAMTFTTQEIAQKACAAYQAFSRERLYTISLYEPILVHATQKGTPRVKV